ncbi:hypothetical protein Tco_0929065 [Tanacetum coccineum]
MVPKSKDWVERLNPDRRLPIFNTERILVPESQAVNESLKPTETSNTLELSKYYEIESLTPLPPLKNLQGASPSSERPDDCRNYPECGICRSYDHFTSGHNRVIHIRGGILRRSTKSKLYNPTISCHVFIHNHKDHLGKFDAKANDGYFLGYSVVLKAFRVFNIRRQQIKETYHVTFDECMEAIRFTNTSVDEIRTDDSSIYPLDEFLHEDDPSRQYQVDFDVSYYVIPHGRSLTELTQENHIPKVIAPNEPDIPLTEDNEGPPDLINTEGTHEQNVQNEQITTQPTEGPSGSNTEISMFINESLVPDVLQSHILFSILIYKTFYNVFHTKN